MPSPFQIFVPHCSDLLTDHLPHGDGLIAHGFGLERRLLHVPLITAGPGAFASDGIFSLAELPARIAAAAGIEDHPYGSTRAAAIAQYDALIGSDGLIGMSLLRRMHLWISYRTKALYVQPLTSAQPE